MGICYLVETADGLRDRLHASLPRGIAVTLDRSDAVEITEDPATWDTISFKTVTLPVAVVEPPVKVVPKHAAERMGLVAADRTVAFSSNDTPKAGNADVLLKDYATAPTKGTLSSVGDTFTVGGTRYFRLPVQPG